MDIYVNSSGLQIDGSVQTKNLGTSSNHFDTLFVNSISGVSLGTTYSGVSPISVSGSNISIFQATTSTNGYLSSTDWNTFNNKQPSGTYLTTLSGTSPIVVSGSTISYINKSYNEIPITDGGLIQYKFSGIPANNSLTVWKNGLYQAPTVDYTINSATISFVSGTQLTDKIYGMYEWSTAAPASYWDANVVAAWPLATNSLDDSTNGNNLINAAGTPQYTTVGGRACPAKFTNGGPGSTAFAYTFPTIPSFSGLTSWTIEWYNYTNTHLGRPHVEMFDHNSNFSYYATNASTWTWNWANLYFPQASPMPSGQWQHVAFVKSPGAMKIYFDNALSSNTVGNWTFGKLSSANSWIGRDWYTGWYFDGYICQMVLSNVARTTFPTRKIL